MNVVKCWAALSLLVTIAGCGKSTDHWKAQLKSSDPVARLHAVHALRDRAKDPAVVPVLAQALDDEDTFIRRDAARALGKFGPNAKEATPKLQASLTDKEPSVRKAAAESLKKIESAANGR
jgi:HEAT repeat protein